MRPAFIVLIVTAVLAGSSLLTGCTPPAAPNPAQPPAPAAPTRDPNLPTRPGPTPPPLQGEALTVEQRMLSSSATWKTLVAEADIINYTGGANAPVQSDHVQVWIEQPARFRVIVRPGAGGPVRMTVSDGQNLRYESGETSPLPPDLATPFAPPAGPSDTVVQHPLGSSLGVPQVGDLLFPVGLAQRSGEYKTTGKDTIAGRTATVLEWSYVAGQLVDRLWVDEQTGVVLRQDNFGKGAAETPQNQVVVTFIQFDQPIPAETFALDQPTPEAVGALPGAGNGPFITVLKSDAGVINVRSGPGTVEYPVIGQMAFGQTARVTGKSVEGEWWQIEFNGGPAWVWKELVQLTGDPASIPVAAP